MTHKITPEIQMLLDRVRVAVVAGELDSACQLMLEVRKLLDAQSQLPPRRPPAWC